MKVQGESYLPITGSMVWSNIAGVGGVRKLLKYGLLFLAVMYAFLLGEQTLSILITGEWQQQQQQEQ